jgi:hypothetical protein
MEAIQKILQETVAPGITDIRERLARVEVEIKRLDDKIDNGLARLESKMDNGFERQNARMDHLDDKLSTALEIRERLAALEAKVASR